MDWDAFRLGFDLLQFAVLGGVGIYVWSTNRTKARREVTEALDRRLIKVESALESMPTIQAVHELSVSMTQLSGELKTALARVDGLEDVVERVERIVNRQEEHLLARSRVKP